MKRTHCAVAVALSMVLTRAAGAQVAPTPATSAATAPVQSTRRTVPAIRTSVPPVIDGDLGDAVWKTAPMLDHFWDQDTGTGMIDQTRAWIVYDSKYLYVAFECTDSVPDGIVGRETVRDSHYSNGNQNSPDPEDSVELVLDPFNSHNHNDLTRFALNPLGTQSAQSGGGRANKAEWSGDWRGAVKRNATGWTAEMQIPWSILNYPPGRATLSMGINFRRYQYRTKVQSIWSNVGQQGFLDLEGQWTGVHVPIGTFRPAISILPYVLPSVFHGHIGVRSGLDARVTATPDLTAVISLNPDFGTIEGAVEGIQFSRTERFVPEKRPFFLEGARYLSAGQPFELGQYFYSRRIQSFNTGIKVFGKVTPSDSIGILDTTQFGNRNDLIARYTHNLSATSTAGLFVSEMASKTDYNRIAVMDSDTRWNKLEMGTQLAFSGGRTTDGRAADLNFAYNDKNRFYFIQYQDVTPNFGAADGIIGFTDYRGINVFTDGGAQWRHGFFRGYDVAFGPQVTWHQDGRPFQRGAFLDANIDTRSDFRLDFNVLRDKFDDQTDEVYGVGIISGVSNRFRQFGFMAQTGRQAGQPYSFVGPTVSLRVLRKMDVSYGGAIQSFQGGQQQHIATVTYELAPTQSIGGRVVVQNSNTNWYVSYRNSGKKGTETYVILGDPNTPRFVGRLAVKFVFAI